VCIQITFPDCIYRVSHIYFIKINICICILVYGFILQLFSTILYFLKAENELQEIKDVTVVCSLNGDGGVSFFSFTGIRTQADRMKVEYANP